jgi:hypothetical protein
MIYITFERGDPKFSNTTARALALRTAASVESKMATMQHKQSSQLTLLHGCALGERCSGGI